MHVSRGVFNVGMAVRKLSSRFRHPQQAPRKEWLVISAARPLFYLIRFFGLAPFEISEDRFILGSYSVIYSFFFTFFNSYVIYIIMTTIGIRRDTSMLGTIETVKVLFNYCVAILNVLMAIWTRKEFIGVLHIVKYFDSRVRDLGYPRKEGVTTVGVWILCISIVSLWIAVNRTGMAAFSESWVYNAAYILNYAATSLATVKFSSTVLLLGQRFQDLNRIAQRSKESETSKQKYIAVDFKVIQQLHNSLMNAGESLSSQYSWPLLLWLTNLCMHSVNNLYFLIDWLMTAPEWAPTRWPLVTALCGWLVAFVAQLLLLHIACHFTSAEANNMGPIVSNWSSSTISQNYRIKSSLHLINRQLNFSAAGCFHVNLPLLRSITALVTTYLVLLMQFQG